MGAGTYPCVSKAAQTMCAASKANKQTLSLCVCMYVCVCVCVPCRTHSRSSWSWSPTQTFPSTDV